MWWILVPLGFTAWLSPLIAGVRTQRKVWVVSGIGWLCLWVVGLAITAGTDEDSGLSDIGVTLWLASWLAPLVHTIIIRPEYERVMAVVSDPRLAQRTVAIEQQQYAHELVQKDPLRARNLGIGRPDVDGAFDAGVVDLNHASVDAIVKVTGIDRATAERIVANRDEVGGFRSVEELGALLDVPASTVDGLRLSAVFLPI